MRLVGMVVVIVGSLLPLASGLERSYTVAGMATTRWVMATAVLVAGLSIVAEARTSRTEASRAAAVSTGVILTVVPLLALALLEALTIWISPEELPIFFRRLAIQPLVGLWLISAGGALVLVSGTDHAGHVTRFVMRVGSAIRERSKWGVAVILSGIGFLFVAFGRYGTWFEGVILGYGEHDQAVMEYASIDPSMRSLPWLGFGSLVGVFVILGLLFLACTRRRPGAGAVLVVAGWLVTLPSALLLATIVDGRSVDAPLQVEHALEKIAEESDDYIATANTYIRWIPDGPDPDTIAVPRDLEVTLETGSGAALLITGGLMVAAGGLLFVADVTSTAGLADDRFSIAEGDVL